MTKPAAAPTEHKHHGVTLPILGATLLALLVLTVITVGVTWFPWLDFGPRINLWVALIIATVKASLVALYFMHLRYDKPFNAVVLISALFFVILFIGAALQDSAEYRANIDEYRAADPAKNYAPAMPPQP